MISSIKIERLVVGEMQTNCYLVYADGEGIVIDPGGGEGRIMNRIEELNLCIPYIICTHGHIDHILAVSMVKEKTGAQLMIHAADKDMLTDSIENLSTHMGSPYKTYPADRLLNHHDSVAFSGLSFEVRHTPGHTPGGISLYFPGHIFSGDTLFDGSIGRYDLPGSSQEKLLVSIKMQILSLDDWVIVHPGHGEETTVGRERESNPFLTFIR